MVKRSIRFAHRLASAIRWRRFAMAVLTSVFISQTSWAPVLAQSSAGIDFTNNDVQTYDPNGNCTQTPGGSTTITDSSGVDPKANEIFNQQIAPKLTRFKPLYQQAAKAEGLNDWQLMAGFHYMESGMSDTNPTTNPDFRGIFQQSASGLRFHGIDPFGGAYASGKKLTDADIVTQAQDAIRFYVKSKAAASSVNVDISKPLTADGAAKISIAYKSGEGSVWFTGKADPNLHAYTYAGYDTTATHRLPMAWGPGSPFGDEVGGTTIDRPGVLTVWKIVGGGGGGGTCGGGNSGTTGGVAFWSQRDPRWANQDFLCGNSPGCGSTYGNNGCYPTDLAMIVTTFTGKIVHPNNLIGGDPGEQQLADSYKIKTRQLGSFDEAYNTILDAQRTNKQLVVFTHGGYGRIFITYNHWVLMRGVATDGNIFINDPYDMPALPPTDPSQPGGTNLNGNSGRPYSLKEWTRADFVGHADEFWAYTKD